MMASSSSSSSSSAAAALELLVSCAHAIQDGNLELADSLLHQIWNLAAQKSDKNQSLVVKYFAEALVRRAYGLHPTGTYSKFPMTPLSYHIYYDLFDGLSEMVGDAINNTLIGKKRLHLIDFHIPHLYGEEYLFNTLPYLSGNPLSVRVSVILPPFLKNTVNVQDEMQYLTRNSKQYNIKLEDELKVIYAECLGEVDAIMLNFRRTEDEAVMVHYNYKLHKLLIDAEAMKRELIKLRQINPDIVIMQEYYVSYNDSNFIRRLGHYFKYFSNVLGLNLFYYYFNNYRQFIHNIVGRDRIVQYQTLAEWQYFLLKVGFLQVPIKDFSIRKSMGVDIYEEKGCLVGSYNNCPLFFLSAWKFKVGEEHFNFNQNINNFLQGLNPSPLLDNIVQPFQPFPKGLALNRLAAFAEIYDMLEDVCSKYDLPLALTWTCEANVNGIMSDPYKKRTLFIESTSYYVNDEQFQWFMEICAEHHLQEGQGIAGKALQSSDGFHFEPSITNLEELDNPFLRFALDLGTHAAVGICLQNHYAINDVYVVEFYWHATKTEKPESLALNIFNYLKNMKKKFVTLRIRGTEDGEKAISNTTRSLNTVEARDVHALKIQGLNEQRVDVVPNFPSLVPTFTTPNPMSYNGVPQIQGPHEQGNGKQNSFEPNANNENEMLKADINNLPISTAKRRKLTSNVWEEFTKQPKDGDGKEWAICAHCNKKFDGASKKGTTHLRNHLERCKSRTTKVTDQQLIFPVGKGDSKAGSFVEGNSSFDQDRCSMDVARMIIKHQLPLNMVEFEFFNILLKNLQPMFKLQSQEALSSDIFRVYEEEKVRLVEYFDKLSCRFNLTISLWAHDLEKKTTCCYSVQFIDDNWELKKKILALKIFGQEFDTMSFYENFKSLLVNWNLDKKVCSLTIHNSSSSSEIDEEIRKSWTSFEASHPLSTFYISSDECIHGLLLDKDISGESVGKSIDSVIKTSNACLRDIHDHINFRKLSQLERKSHPLMNVKSNDINWRTCSLVLAIAAVLDPRFKFGFVEFLYTAIYGNEASRTHLTMIRNALTGIFNEYECNMYSGTPDLLNNSLILLNAEENTMESFHRWYNSTRNVSSTESSWKPEIDKYLQEPIISSNLEFDVLGWWIEHASSFPVLGSMARDILAIPMSSIISGSTFNEKVMMDNPIFSGLDPEIIEAMVCGKDWLESPTEISNFESNMRGNIGNPIVKLKDNPPLAHHSELESSSESDIEVPWNEYLGREARAWSEKDVRAYLISRFTEKENKRLYKWQNHETSGRKLIGRDKEFGLMDYKLAPLLIVPHGDHETRVEYYIDDSVVNIFFKLLKKRSDRFPKAYINHYSFDSGIATYLIKGSRSEDEVLDWFKAEKLIGVHKLFLPLCLSAHWVLFYVDTKEKKFSWLDSNASSRMSNNVEKLTILRWFISFLLPVFGYNNANEWPFVVRTDIPEQKNLVDCGLFVMKYADCLTHGDFFPFTQEDMPHFRLRTFLDIYRGRLHS